MQDNMTITDLSSAVATDSLKYTCLDCNFKTREKSQMDIHVDSLHTDSNHEEVNFVCATCNHEFVEKDGFNEHVRTHDNLNTDKGTDVLLKDTTNYDVPTSLDELSENATDVIVERIEDIAEDAKPPISKPMDKTRHMKKEHVNKDDQIKVQIETIISCVQCEFQR